MFSVAVGGHRSATRKNTYMNRELQDMTAASDGGGGSWKSGHSYGVCGYFIVLIRSKCGQGWRGSKNVKKLLTSYLEAPLLNKVFT